MKLEIFGDVRQIAVERALSELRAARPVMVRDGRSAALVFSAEGLTAEDIPFLQQEGRGTRLVLPNHKVKSLHGGSVTALRLKPLSIETIESAAGHTRNGARADKTPYQAESLEPSPIDIAALTLANLALLLPATVVSGLMKPELAGIPALTVNASEVLAFRDRAARTLRIVARSLVPLDEAGVCEFVVFRGGDGFRDQIAIIVGKPEPGQPVLTRIHSACLTGDLFGSLKCDCGDQLRGTVQVMAEQGGGVLLYLDQEGRGNGIANKIRAYCLQENGLDTFDADEALGFGKDQRRFDFAADMLKQLGFHSIRLMTNNPAKIAALRNAGLDVVSTHRVHARANVHNAKYLAAKRDRAGHLIGDTALDGADGETALQSSLPPA